MAITKKSKTGVSTRQERFAKKIGNVSPTEDKNALYTVRVFAKTLTSAYGYLLSESDTHIRIKHKKHGSPKVLQTIILKSDIVEIQGNVGEAVQLTYTTEKLIALHKECKIKEVDGGLQLRNDQGVTTVLTSNKNVRAESVAEPTDKKAKTKKVKKR